MKICKLSGIKGICKPGEIEQCVGAFPGEGCGGMLRLTKFGRLPTHSKAVQRAQKLVQA